jgi:ABC-type dipeptide/oligopeptide/nickel transport system ATPase subunit
MAADPFLSVRGLGKSFAGHAAIQDVTFSLERGHTLGVVGPSGSGKSTLARCLAFFEAPDSGEIWLDGRNLCGLNRRERAAMRADIQLIFQEPASSLNPRFTAAEIVMEPLLIRGIGTAKTRRLRASELMETVGLPRQAGQTPALEFSGGERQRLAIARALALEPKLLILDESFAGLDLSVQAQVTGLLLDVQERRGLTYILIAHDLALVWRLAGEIAVMDQGSIVEHAGVADLVARPKHPLTRELLDAALALSLEGAPA